MISIIICIGLLLVVRTIEYYLFMRRAIKICKQYDWKYVEQPENVKYLVDMLSNPEHYYEDNKWSAYNFLLLNGPNPIKIFFYLKVLTIDNIYNKESINKLKKYEVI